MKLPEELADWTDWDWAGYVLARSTGLMDESVPFATDAKHVFWTDHPVGTALSNMLDELVACSVLERRDEPDFQYRWNPLLKGSWE